MASPAVSTSPAFTAAATSREITFHLIDASGDLFTFPVNVPIAASAASIQAIGAAYQAATQASWYKTTETLVREGDPDPDNADNLIRFQGESGINMLFRNPTTLVTETLRLIAPIPAAMQGNSDTPLISATEPAALITAILAVKTGYSFGQAQYTTRRERKNNTRVK